MKKADVLARIDAVLQRGLATIMSVGPTRTDSNPDNRWVKEDVATGFRIAGLSLLQGLYGEEHQTYKDFANYTNERHVLRAYRQGHALISAVREEVERGWFENIRSLISADVFSDILEMAGYLLSEGYKDAAAVLVGGSLEGHLRALSPRHGVDVQYVDKNGIQRSKKAETLNQELHRAKAYELGDQKQVTAWLNLRNDAAHTHYDKYSAEQVNLMLQGVQNFIMRIPA